MKDEWIFLKCSPDDQGENKPKLKLMLTKDSAFLYHHYHHSKARQVYLYGTYQQQLDSNDFTYITAN